MLTPAFIEGLRCPCCMTPLALEGDVTGVTKSSW